MKTTKENEPKEQKQERKPLPIWVHYLIAGGIVLAINIGIVIGWNLRSINQSNVENEAKVLVQELKSAK